MKKRVMLTSASTTWLSPEGRLQCQTEGPHTWVGSQSSPGAHAPYAGSGVGEEQELATHVETKSSPSDGSASAPGMSFHLPERHHLQREWWLLSV